MKKELFANNFSLYFEGIITVAWRTVVVINSITWISYIYYDETIDSNSTAKNVLLTISNRRVRVRTNLALQFLIN